MTVATPATTPFLHVQGREILDADGQAIFLRGVNIDTYYYRYVWDPAAPSSYATRADIEYLDDLGVTAIRLSLHWRYFETALGHDLIDAYLDWCEQAGIHVILDMHVVPPEDDILEGRIWDDPVAQEQFIDLWTDIAARYAGRTIVAGYDLYNEPAPPDAAQWWELAGRTATAIRTVDANHILFVENPLTGDGAFPLLPLADPNVVYSFHDYFPFVVSHAGAAWVGDSPVPDDYVYPGPALVGMEWADWSEDAAVFAGRTDEWLYWDSGLLTVPAGVAFATLKPATHGNAGAVWFDDLELEYNGVPRTIYNPGMETASGDDSGQPANWNYWSDSGFSGEWSGEYAHNGDHSLKIGSDGDGFGVWTQSESIFTDPLIPVQAGDTLRVRGWIYAPQNNGGGVSLGLDYLNGVYANYDRDRLLADMQPYIDWATANNVPLQVGEFGVMSSAPGDSRWNWIADKIDAMNEAGLHWALWTYREPSAPGFGLYHGDDPDGRLVEILRQGLEAASVIVGTAGNDRFTNNPGDDFFDGLAGIDTVVFTGDRAGYRIDLTADGRTIGDQTGTDGTDTLTAIERLEFADHKLALDLSPGEHAGQALEFIGALAFNVIHSPDVVGAILSFFDQGQDLTSLSQLAIEVGLVRDLAGSGSNDDLARLVWRNIIGSEANAIEVDMLVSYMDGRNASYSQAEFIATVAALEVNQQHIDLVGLQETGVEFA